MTLYETVKSWLGIGVQPTERKISDMIISSNIEQDAFGSRVTGMSFNPGSTYFGVRLSGLHLVDARQFATERLPLCVCLAEFESGGERRVVPFSIGPDVIRSRLKGAGVDKDLGGSAWVELRDITVIRPIPVSGSNLSLYAGLFSVPGDDLVRTLLNVIGTVGSALSVPSAGSAVQVAGSVYDSFGSLLGFSQVSQVVAALVGNALTDRGSGYLLLGNFDPARFPLSTARVVAGRLHWPSDIKGGGPVREFDYILLAIERLETVIEPGTNLSSFLFGPSWKIFREAKSREAANEALQGLRDAIAASPDVTEDDRLKLLVSYGSAAESLIAARWPTAVERTRGNAGASFSVGLGNAVVARKKDRVLVARLGSAASSAKKFPGLPAKGANRDGKDEDVADAELRAIFTFASSITLSPASKGASILANRIIGRALELSEPG